MLSITLIFLSIGLGLFIIKRINEIRKSYICPQETVIKEYFEGRLKKRDRVLYEKVITHLGICEKCQNILEGYVHEDDSSNIGIEDHLVED